MSTVNLACSIDLKDIGRFKNTEYKKNRNFVIMRITEPKTTALIFKSGKMLVTGAIDEASSRVAARKFVRIIQKLY